MKSLAQEVVLEVQFLGYCCASWDKQSTQQCDVLTMAERNTPHKICGFQKHFNPSVCTVLVYPTASYLHRMDKQFNITWNFNTQKS